jgi:hypothetical protein
MWFRRAADDLREKARRLRDMAIVDDDTPVSARLLHIAKELEAKADEIEGRPTVVSHGEGKAACA